MDIEVVEHYGTHGQEDARLRRSPHGRLEFLRTQELIRRWLPGPGAGVPAGEPVRVLDVGGGTGVHAAWLAADGHAVEVIDPVPSHVRSAAALPGVDAQMGDARQLPFADGSVDAVLLLGPLYHLTDSRDRSRALGEAVRVLRPGGLVVAAGISRYLSLLETGTNGRLGAELLPGVESVIENGRYDGHVGFMPTHFHTARELGDEVRAAGLVQTQVYGVEGPAWPALDAAGPAQFDALVEAALSCARIVEQDPAMINVSAHLLAVAHTPIG